MGIHDEKPTVRRPEATGTWNSPEDIARHRAMTPAQRWRKTVQLSQAALRMARTERIDGR